MAASSSSSSLLQIMWEALQLPAKAGAIFIPLLLLSFLSSSLLFFSAYSVSPLVLDLLSKLASFFKNPVGPPASAAFSDLFLDIEKDLRSIARLGSLIALFFFFASLFLAVATTYTFLAAYAGEALSPKKLLHRVARRWYQCLVTRLYVVLLSLGLALLSSLVIGAVVLVSGGGEGGSEIADRAVMSLASAGGLLYLYLSTRWAMSLVVAVAEETWGIGALSMSVVLFIGNKKKGTLLTLALKAVQAAIYGAFAVALATAGPSEAQMGLWLGVAAASAVWEVYAMAAYTVFYHECRKSHGLEDGAKTVLESGFFYAHLPAPPAAAAVVVTCCY